MKIVAPIAALVLLLGFILWLEDERPRADVVWVHATDLFTLDPQKEKNWHETVLKGTNTILDKITLRCLS